MKTKKKNDDLTLGRNANYSVISKASTITVEKSDESSKSEKEKPSCKGK